MFSFKNIRKKLLVLAATITCVSVIGCTQKENEEYADLDIYLNITNIDGNDGVAIIIDGEAKEVGYKEGETYYLPYELVRASLDKNYYWDESEQLLTYATSKHIYDAKVDAVEYTEDGVVKNNPSKIVTVVNEEVYISFDYIKLMNSAVDGASFDEPSRLVFYTAESVNVATAKSDTKLRSGLSKRDEIVKDIKKGDKLVIIEENDDRILVCAEDGLMGYIESSKLSEGTLEPIQKKQGWMDTDKYEYISMDEKVCLGWHQMESDAGTNSLSSVINGTEGLNVISPTWFKLIDDYGAISSLATSSYVTKAHNNDLQVWGLISDFNYDEEGNYYVNKVVTNTTSRRTLINNIIEEANKCGMDGINVDFEMIRKTAAHGYVQFIRELAIECEKAGLVLSVDMYVPSESNQYYDRESVGLASDYLIIMGYDEHWATCGTAGSVASLPFVTKGINDTLESVPASRVINAIPFYTRVWYEDSLENAPDGSIIVEDSMVGDYALSSRAVGMGAAEKFIKENGGSVRWLEDLGQNYGEYYTPEGSFARVWLEDKESLTAKLNVMKENNIAGVACWKLGLDSEEAWEVIGAYLK